MNIKVKFYMMFNCGKTQIRTLDDLRENFCIEDVLTHYEDGRLEKWLDVWRYRPELEAVRELKASGKTNAREILAELMRIFGADMDEAEIDSELEVYDYVEERRKFREYMISNGLHDLQKKCEDLQNERDVLKKELNTIRQRFFAFKDRASRFFSLMSKAISYVFINQEKNIEEAKELQTLLSNIPL